MIDETGREPLDEGGTDYGSDLSRDLGDGPPSSFRDTAPDVLAPIDADAPISGHVPAAADAPSPSLAPEHDWEAARSLLIPSDPAGRDGRPAPGRREPERAGAQYLEPHPAAARRRPVRAARRLCDPRGRLRCGRERRASGVVGRRAADDRRCGDGQSGDLVGRRGVDRRGIRRSAADLVRLAATARTPPGSCCPTSGRISSATSVRPGGSSSACPTVTCSWPEPRPPATPNSRTSWPASLPIKPTVPTSRSTGACSSLSPASCCRRPAERDHGAGLQRAPLGGRDGVVTITLDRPAALNSLEAGLKAELLAALRDAGRDPAVRVVVLTGAGRAFCAGQDLKERLAPDPTPLDVEVRERFNPLVRAIAVMDKPVIAVDQRCRGRGRRLARLRLRPAHRGRRRRPLCSPSAGSD